MGFHFNLMLISLRKKLSVAALVNKLWKRMDKLESEKRNLQIKLDQPVSEPPSPR